MRARFSEEPTNEHEGEANEAANLDPCVYGSAGLRMDYTCDDSDNLNIESGVILAKTPK